ncbi:MAG: helix-turn-helix domain-containing protein [Acidobacteriia bacterium]|nr:helix-turn-helix domain-containing protein [Terriglobia bacterium]
MRFSQTSVTELQTEIRRSEELRYAHRLHGVFLLAKGMTYQAVAKALGESTRTLANWVHRYRLHGLSGLHEETRSGRPPRLSETQCSEIATVTCRPPEDSGLAGTNWTARLLAEWIDRRFAIRLSPRQCRRLLREPGRPGTPN